MPLFPAWKSAHIPLATVASTPALASTPAVASTPALAALPLIVFLFALPASAHALARPIAAAFASAHALADAPIHAVMRGIAFPAPALADAPARAVPGLKLLVEPENPKPQSAFRVTLRAVGIGCEKLPRLDLTTPPEFLKIGESKIEAKEGCERILNFSSLKAGRFTITGIRAPGPFGNLSHPDVEVVIGEGAPALRPPTKKLSPGDAPGLLAFTRTLLTNLLPVQEPAEAVESKIAFTVESCRLPLAKIADLHTKKIASYAHTFAFQDACDLNGSIEVFLGAPFSADLAVRNLDPIRRVQGTITIRTEPDINFQLTQKTEVKDGVLIGHANEVLARFEFTHAREMLFNIVKGTMHERKNSGVVRFVEFAGAKSQLEEKF